MLTFDVDTTKLDKLLPEYYKETTKTMEEVLNTKAYYIARNAVQETIAVSKGQIKKELMESVVSKTGRHAPRAAMIINRKRGRRGSKGLYGAEMADAIERLIAKRQRTINFLKAGWIPAIKKLQPLVDKNYRGSGGLVTNPSIARGADKGGALPATQSTGGGILKAQVQIWNSVRGDTKPQRVVKRLTEGLQRAIDREVASMQVYLEKKLHDAADRTINK